MRIAIVNDMVLGVEALRRVVVTEPGYTVAWIAKDGAEAVERCAADRPDLILMDLLMPVMDGVEATRRIMANSPCAILVVTATVSGNISKVFDAMGSGALDAVCTPELGLDGDMGGAETLLNKIRMIRVLLKRRSDTSVMRKLPAATPGRTATPLVAIGSSTGGPQALADVLALLPTTFSAAVVLIQHVDALFAPGLAEWLSYQSPIKVNLIKAGDRALPGKAWLANTNDHVVFNPDLTFNYTPEPRSYPYRPSVDVFFESAAQYYPGVHTAILLTGMGRDGAKGLLTLRQQKWLTIAQDQKSCVVYGMPKAAAEMKAAAEVLSIKAIGQRLAELDQTRNKNVKP